MRINVPRLILSDRPQDKKERECLPKVRKYQTLSSISKEIKNDKLFKLYFELEEQMFSLFSTQKYYYMSEYLKPINFYNCIS